MGLGNCTEGFFHLMTRSALRDKSCSRSRWSPWQTRNDHLDKLCKSRRRSIPVCTGQPHTKCTPLPLNGRVFDAP